MSNREIKFRAWHKVERTMICEGWNGTHGQRFATKATFFELGDSVELMQFTGLKDKNGVEIYEGDIVRVPQFPRPLFVKWDSNGYFLFEGICNEANLGGDNDEVLGNIYEHPELLESQRPGALT